MFPERTKPAGSDEPDLRERDGRRNADGHDPGDAVGTALRITDHANPNNPATVTDTQFPVPVDCQPAAPAGSNCGLNVSVNALVGAAIVTGTVADIEVGQITMLDQTGSPFAVQGIFAP